MLEGVGCSAGRGKRRACRLGQKWLKARPTRTWVFWSWVACAAVTMLIGFTWAAGLEEQPVESKALGFTVGSHEDRR